LLQMVYKRGEKMRMAFREMARILYCYKQGFFTIEEFQDLLYDWFEGYVEVGVNEDDCVVVYSLKGEV
jgi:predicted membrane GTPase involved in stress response